MGAQHFSEPDPKFIEVNRETPVDVSEILSDSL